MPRNDENVRCSFCGKFQEEVSRLIAGPNVFICNECVALCANILQDEMTIQGDFEDVPDKLPTPMEMTRMLTAARVTFQANFMAP